MGEEDPLQTYAAQLNRMARIYPVKAKDLKDLGKWPQNAPRCPEKSAEIRIQNPASLYQRAKKAIEVIVNQISPIWSIVLREQQSGWGKEDFIRETKKR